MTSALRIAPLVLVLFPFLSYAQTGAARAVGVELPAPALPSRGHFLTGTYVIGNYSPLATASGYGYGVQPYLRYQFGSSPTGRPRPFVQYSFPSYHLPAYGTGPLYGPEGSGRPANLAFAPLPTPNTPYGYDMYGSYGGLGALSVGVPMQVGRSSAVLNVGGTLLQGLLNPSWR